MVPIHLFVVQIISGLQANSSFQLFIFRLIWPNYYLASKIGCYSCVKEWISIPLSPKTFLLVSIETTGFGTYEDRIAGRHRQITQSISILVLNRFFFQFFVGQWFSLSTLCNTLNNFDFTDFQRYGTLPYKLTCIISIVMPGKIVRLSVTCKNIWGAFKTLQNFICTLFDNFWKQPTKPRLFCWNSSKKLERYLNNRQNLGLEAIIWII